MFSMPEIISLLHLFLQRTKVKGAEMRDALLKDILNILQHLLILLFGWSGRERGGEGRIFC